MRLILPSLTYKRAYLDALEETKYETGRTRLNKPEVNESFEGFVKRLNNYARGMGLPEGYVPSTMFWLINKDQLIGRVDIRHRLTRSLLRHGGHIGYYIRPSKRKMGYGRKILEFSLLKAERLGLSRVLLTCDDDNIGSRKIIEVNGGVLKNIIEPEKNKPKTRRYWIIIK